MMEKVFATQRGYGEFKDGWEFPGGKIDAGESVLKEHEAAAWLTKETLYSVDWLPTDQGLIPQIYTFDGLR